MSRQKRLWMILALALLVALVCWPSTTALREQWSDFVNSSYTHGWLVLPICIALVIRSRREISTAAARRLPLAPLALAGCVWAWLVCYRASIQDAHTTLVPAIFWLAATAAFGWTVGRLLIFPVAFFYFAVPSWWQLADPLQDLTVVAMRVFLGLTGPEALISGDLIHIPNGTFEIQEGCSGVHFMIVGLAVATLYGELRRDPWRTRLAQLTLMAALALLANWVRVYVIIRAGYLTDMRSSLLRNHYWFGWGVFAAALLIFFWVSARHKPAAAPAEPASEPAPQPGAHAASPRADWVGFTIAAMILVALPATSTALRTLRPAASLPPALSADPRAPWVPALLDIHSSWQPVFAGAARQERRAFADTGGDSVEVFAVTYRTQRQGAKLIGSGTSLSGRTLSRRSEEVVQSPWGRFRENEVVERAAPHERYWIWSRYESAGREFVSPLGSQLWYGINATVSNPSASLVALRAVCRPDCSTARRTLREFAASAALP
jgi:exosortase